MPLVPKIIQTCEDCGITGFDDQAGCSVDCDQACAGCYRMADGCTCTCKDYIRPRYCPTFAYVEDCSCEGGATAAGGYILGAWLGWGDGPTGHTLADVALATAPEDPRVFYYVYGAPTLLACPVDISLLGDPIVALIDTVAPVERDAEGKCVGGAAFVDAAALGIEIVPTEGGTGTDCDQTGGLQTLLLVAKNTRGETLLICPFLGPQGGEGCDFTLTCCQWLLSETFHTCDEDGGTTFIERTYSLSESCDCVPDLIVTVDGTDYTAIGSSLTIMHEITPCTPGQVISIRTQISYPGTPGCTHCIDQDFTENVTL